jgi:hypothetical protein
MPGPVKQFPDFSQNTNNDTGENNAASIQPIEDGENVVGTVLQRPSESLRQRTEVVRSVEMDSLYLRDADRNLILSGPGKITWPGSTTALASGIPSIDNNLYLIPMLTPGSAQTPPIPPVASAYGTLSLKRASDSMNSILVTSQRRSYAAGDQISIDVVAGGSFSCTLDPDAVFQRTIHIVATGSTQLSTVIAALNALTPVVIGDTAPLVTAALEGGALGTDLLLTTQAKQFVSGNYDGEGHTITPAVLASFFVSNPTQALAEGDTLCINFAMVSDTASTGGRRQAIPENSNTAVTAGAFFNSRVHPENLVNALPICKVVNGNLVFATGVEVAAGDVDVALSAVNAGSLIIRNPGFESGVTLGTNRFAITDWENRADLAVNGAFRVNTTAPNTGAKQLEFNQTAIGAATGRIEQEQEIPVVAGQVLRVVVAIKQLIAPTAGSYVVGFYWGDADSNAAGSSTVPLQVLSTTDASYRNISQAVVVPAGKRFLKLVTVEVVGVTLGSTGVSVLFDDMQVTVETLTGQIPAVDNAHLKPTTIDAAIIEDPATYILGQLAALLRFDKSTPASEGRAIIERKDQNYTGANLPPALAHFGRFFQLGSALLGSSANAAKPRISADTSTVGGALFTLMWESGPQGQTTGTYTEPVVRFYASNDGQYVMTSNAVWGGATWSKDITGQAATKFAVGKDGLRLQTHTASIDTAWTDSGWDDTMRITNPLVGATDPTVPRASFSLADGGAGTINNLISQITINDQIIRTYASRNNLPRVQYFTTFNAAWNGTLWVKDNNTFPSSRQMVFVDYSELALDTNRPLFSFNLETYTANTATFADTDWNSDDSKSEGGQLQSGFVYAGPPSDFDPTGTPARVKAVANFHFQQGFQNAVVMDNRNLAELGIWRVNPFGCFAPEQPYIFEEFFAPGTPDGWSAGGTGTVTYNKDGYSRVQLSGAGSAFIETTQSVSRIPGSSFWGLIRWDNVTGTASLGFYDLGGNLQFGFVQDSGTYGDEHIRIACRSGAGGNPLEVLDTGFDASTSSTKFIQLSAWLETGPSDGDPLVIWQVTKGTGPHLEGSNGFSGIFQVPSGGFGVATPTTPWKFVVQGGNNGSITVDRVTIMCADEQVL